MRLDRLFQNVQQDLKFFVSMLLLLCVYRAAFIGTMGAFLAPDTTRADILAALFAGLRLSLKSAGAVTLFPFVFVTLAGVVSPRLSWPRLRLAFGAFTGFLLSVLFMARYPYYREFHAGFGMEILHGLQDDRAAIFWTMVEQYGAVWRVAAAALLAAIFFLLLRRLLQLGTLALPRIEGHGKRCLAAGGLVLSIGLFFVFVRFGGSFNYEKGINWENAGITKDAFLNECILDDVQALYRVRSIEKQMKAGETAGVEADRIEEHLRQIAGHDAVDGTAVAPYLLRRAAGARIEKPRHIFIVLGETWAMWPALDRYASLHAADGLRALMAETDAYSTRAFLPNGEYTSIAIMGFVCGLPEVHVAPQVQPRTFEAPYATAMAPPFHSLGYQVDFWYGGLPAWDSINRVSLAQGFDHFYGYPDFDAPRQSAWGTKDGCLFDALYDHLADEPPTVHLIMTVSNHPPYNIDLAAEGIDLARIREAVDALEDVPDPEELALELGHYAYMDKVVTDFVRRTRAAYPESLFVITGDHSVRMDPSGHPTRYEHEAVPFVLYGNGITKDILPKDAAGGHLSIVPTLLELIAPAGYAYHSLCPGLAKSRAAFNNSTWTAGGFFGATDGQEAEPIPQMEPGDLQAARSDVARILPAVRTVGWWMIVKGE
ncbi:LTA synthase family protein [Mitsuokella sp. oral taxon 131]|uniref:LTA synthase family protein n=1 Tax=Mitsuokella sp. oral taxon 131 TaxID=1321780 RepID=UPI0003AE2DC2|nr:arylsulfatase [Mitsuokella sp. oral taxon 131 str. W9106]